MKGEHLTIIVPLALSPKSFDVSQTLVQLSLEIPGQVSQVRSHTLSKRQPTSMSWMTRLTASMA